MVTVQRGTKFVKNNTLCKNVWLFFDLTEENCYKSIEQRHENSEH